jgi:hypothetical protein
LAGVSEKVCIANVETVSNGSIYCRDALCAPLFGHTFSEALRIAMAEQHSVAASNAVEVLFVHKNISLSVAGSLITSLRFLP